MNLTRRNFHSIIENINLYIFGPNNFFDNFLCKLVFLANFIIYVHKKLDYSNLIELKFNFESFMTIALRR